MTIPQSAYSPLAQLVLFIICLAFAGSCVAGAHYAAVDLPAQKAVQAPENSQGNGNSGNQPVFDFTPGFCWGDHTKCRDPETPEPSRGYSG